MGDPQYIAHYVWTMYFHLLIQVGMCILQYMALKDNIEYTVWVVLLQQIRVYMTFFTETSILSSEYTKEELFTQIFLEFCAVCFCYFVADMYRQYDMVYAPYVFFINL